MIVELGLLSRGFISILNFTIGLQFIESHMEDPGKKFYLVLFGQSLRQLRSDAGFSQEELAERAGIDRSYLGAIERGEHNLALINIIKLAVALNLKPYRLLESLDNQGREL